MELEEIVDAVREICLRLRDIEYPVMEVELAGLTIEYWQSEYYEDEEPFGGDSMIVLLYAAHHCRECFACSAEFGAQLYETQVKLNMFLEELKKRNIKFRLWEVGNGAGTLYLDVEDLPPLPVPLKKELTTEEWNKFEKLARQYAEHIKPVIDAWEATQKRFKQWKKAFEQFRKAYEPKPVKVERAR